MNTSLRFTTPATLALLALFLLAPLRSTGASILANGDFGAGNSGFVSDYQYRTCGLSEGTYDVVTNPGCHPFGFSFPDHTSGSGFMFIANGSADTNLAAWREAVTVATNKVYAISGWVASWGGSPTWIDPNAPAMRIIINGTQYGGSVQAQSQAGVWQSFTALWNSGSATSAVVEVRLQTTSAAGNDIALDDLSFAPLTTNQFATLAIYRSVDIEWQSTSNRMYQVQWGSSLPSDRWFNLGPPILARGTNTSVCDRVLMWDKRFYRVLNFE